MKRKITSILAADVADFSRLVAEDEEDTLARLVAAQGVFKTHIVDHGGRIFNTAGDAILAEFASAVEAVRAASAIQAQLHTDNVAYTAGRRLAFRMGVSIGDVVEHGDDLLGDGVNIAARLQGLAPAGGLAISNWVYEQVAGKLDLPFRDIGQQSLKNIPGAVQVYLSDLTATPSAAPERAPTSLSAPRASALSPKLGLAMALVLLATVAALLSPRAPQDTAVVLPSPAAIPTATPVSPPPSYPTLPEPVLAGPPSSSGSPEGDRPPALPVVLQPPASPPARPALPSIALPRPSAAPAPVAPPAAPPRADPPATVVTAPPAPAPTIPIVVTGPATSESPPPVVTPAETVKKPSAAAAPAKKDAGFDPRRRAQLCREIVERAQIGDLSDEDRQILRTQCR